MFNDLQFTLYFSDHPTETKADIGKTMAIVYSNGGRYMKLKSNTPLNLSMKGLMGSHSIQNHVYLSFSIYYLRCTLGTADEV